MHVNVEHVGTPSPFIWNLTMDEMLGGFNSVVDCVAYANYLLILLEGNSQLELEQRGTECMRIVNAWSLQVSVTFSTEKTVAMVLKSNHFVSFS